METIRLSAEHNCSRNLQHGIESIDEIIEKKTHLPALQALFGLDNVTHADDFAAVLNVGDSNLSGRFSTLPSTSTFRRLSGVGRARIGILQSVRLSLTTSAGR